MKAVFVLFIAFLAAPTFGDSLPIGMPCSDQRVQEQRSAELQKIREADQLDRMWQQNGSQPSKKTLEKMSKNDLVRRIRVGQIFGEGCLKSAADYEAAFIVFQHGTTPDHYFQAFLWAKQSMALGNSNLKGEIAMAVDRYLVSIEHKQLFGTQASQPALGGCWCIQPIEDDFPQSLRDEYRGGVNADYTGLAYLKILNAGKNCAANYCSGSLKPSPKGTILGFW